MKELFRISDEEKAAAIKYFRTQIFDESRTPKELTGLKNLVVPNTPIMPVRAPYWAHNR